MPKQSRRSQSEQGAEGKDKISQKPLLKSRFGSPLGPKEVLKGGFNGGNKNVGFDPARFKTQHKG